MHPRFGYLGCFACISLQCRRGQDGVMPPQHSTTNAESVILSAINSEGLTDIPVHMYNAIAIWTEVIKPTLASHEDDGDRPQSNKFFALRCQLFKSSNRNKKLWIDGPTMLVPSALFIASASLVTSSPTLELFSKQAISCLEVGASATARWTNSAGQTCTFTGVVGSNFGANPSGSGE